MKKTHPREDFDLSSIDVKFVFTAKVGVLHSYFDLPFYKRWNYDFTELPILNLISKINLMSMKKMNHIEESDILLDREKYMENQKNIREQKKFCLKLKENIKNNFIKYKMYKNIANNFKQFHINELSEIFLKAPEEELVYFIEKLKVENVLEDYHLLLKSLIFYIVNIKISQYEKVLKKLPNLKMNKNELNDFIHLCENKDMLYVYEYFKDNNQGIYHKMFEKYTQKNISNF